MATDVLPSSLPRVSRGEKVINGLLCRMAYCANCGKPDGWIPVAAEHLTTSCLCNACVEKHGAPAGQLPVAEELLWAKAREAQLEADGRVLTPAEVMRALDDPSHYLSKLAKDAARPTR